MCVLRLVVHMLVNSVVLLTIAGLIESFYISTIWAALGAGIILGLIDVFLKPFLVLLTLPITILSLGLFLIVINAGILTLTSYLMGDAFVIEGFGIAILAAIIMSLLNGAIERVILKPVFERHS